MFLVTINAGSKTNDVFVRTVNEETAAWPLRPRMGRPRRTTATPTIKPIASDFANEIEFLKPKP